MTTPLTFLSTAFMDLESTISDISVQAVWIGSISLVILVFLAVLLNKRVPKIKLPLFVLIVTVVLGTTFIISGATVYLNVKSATGGPVHWHADVEVWACGNELELRDPTGFLSNKIGTPTLHEHNDKRIHLEGVPVTLPHDASLGKFMSVIGGGISDTSMVVPLNEEKLFENAKGEEDGDGNGAHNHEVIEQFLRTESSGKMARFISGQKCGSQEAEVQVFAYRLDEATKTYSQTKLKEPENFAISGHGEVPPGDCVIFEFAPRKDRTDKLCKQYGVRDINRCDEFGVTGDGRKICELREVTPPSSSKEQACRPVYNTSGEMTHSLCTQSQEEQ